MYCDLHTHSTASDGTTPPADLARLARDAGLAALALTDHDTTAGLPACAEACAKLGVAFVPGIELSADPGTLAPASGPPPGGEDSEAPGAAAPAAPRSGTLHILGYFVAADTPALLDIARQLVQAREDRNPQIIRNLQDLGMRITYDEVLEVAHQAGSKIVGRPHIAQVMVRKGYAKTIQDAFTRYIAEGKPAYVRKDRLSPAAAIDAIHGSGGLAVLAHPVQLRLPDAATLEHVVVKLRELGLDGLETRHADHTAADVDRFEKLAARYALLPTGGSDFHGSRKPIALGSQQVPVETYRRLHATWVDRTRER